MQYSIVKVDDSYVIRVGDQDFLKVNSRRKAAKLISDLQRLGQGGGAYADDTEAAADEPEICRPAICYQRVD